MDSATFEMPRTRRIVSGVGSRRRVAEELETSGAQRVAVISSPSVAAHPQYSEIIAALGSRVILEFREIKPHPPTDMVVELIRRCADAKPDAYLAIGGGSVVDCAKFATLGVEEQVTDVETLMDFGVHFEYPDKEWTRPLTGDMRPIFSVPTTLSAAEWDGFAGTVDVLTGTKYVARYLELTPTVVFLDPEVAATTPRPLWATTGMRAVDHAVETSYARNAMPVTTTLALGALAALHNNLAGSVADPNDLVAALECQWAAMMSITGVHNVSLGLSHAIGHQLGGFGVPHGVTSCITLPHVMRFLLPATGPEQARIAQAMGRSSADEAADAVEDLITSLEVPHRIRDVGVDRASFSAIANATLGDVVARESPVTVTHESVIELLEAAW
jgi:alcohol dehydrogenase class IV